MPQFIAYIGQYKIKSGSACKIQNLQKLSVNDRILAVYTRSTFLSTRSLPASFIF